MRLAILVALAGCGRAGFDPIALADGGRDVRLITGRHWVNRNDGTPGKLFSPRMLYDDKRGTVLMYGGGRAFTTTTFPIMWELTPAGWTTLCNPCAPGGRFSQGFAYDPVHDRVVMFGGNSGTAVLGDLWDWDGTTWTQRTPLGVVPMAREAVQLAFDPPSQQLILVGGVFGMAGHGDVYRYDSATFTFSMVTASGGPDHAGGFGHEIEYDPMNHRFLVLGEDAEGLGHVPRDDLYGFDGTSWTTVCTTCSGLARESAALIYDEALHLFWLLGGFAGPTEISGSWQLAGSQWTKVDPLIGGRDSIGVAYDRARDVIVAYGGNGISCNAGDCDETWELVPD